MKAMPGVFALSFSIMASGCAMTSVESPVMAAPAAPVVYQLTVCTDSNHSTAGCAVVSEHPSSGECEAAKKAYLKANPNVFPGCNKKM